MKKIVILLICMVYLTMMSCKQNIGHDHNEQGHSHEETQEHSDHSHDHSENEHEHDHENAEEHSHEQTSEHQHEEVDGDHQHEEDDHEGHDHEYITGKVQLKPFNQIIKTSGEIQADINSEVVLVAVNSGIIHFADPKLDEGSVISVKQAVIYISGEGLVDNNIMIKYNQTKATYEKATANYERAEQLVKKSIISDKEFQQLKLEYLNAKTEFDVISKTYNKGKGVIISPSKAFIKEFYVKEGRYVEAGEKLACIIKQDKLRLIAEVSQKYLNNLSDIESATFLLSNSSKVYNTNELNGRFLSYGKAVKTESFYIPVVFEIDYHKELLPGSFVQIFLKGKKTDNQIVIPKTALVEEQGNYFVFVEESHDKFQKRHVTLGNQDGNNIVVLEGLHVNETIVVEGTYFVKLASMSSELPAHNHAH